MVEEVEVSRDEHEEIKDLRLQGKAARVAVSEPGVDVYFVGRSRADEKEESCGGGWVPMWVLVVVHVVCTLSWRGAICRGINCWNKNNY